MPSCDCCGARILFGGVRGDEHRYCSDDCAGQAFWVQRGRAIPENEVEQKVRQLHWGPCPKCAGAGPVDLHVSHWVYSALVFTKYGSRTAVCCRSCARKGHLKDGAFSLLLGWWGFPFGLLLTPLQVLRNLAGATGLSGPGDHEPSPQFRRHVASRMAYERAEPWDRGLD